MFNESAPELPPGAPPNMRFEGPWFVTQLQLSLTIGVVSFTLFSYCRRHWPLLFAPRTKLKAFSPHEAHAQEAFFGWILPTIRTSEFTVLQIVGLDAAVLLNFYKMSFYLFSLCSIFAMTILMPINWKNNKEDFPVHWPNATLFDDEPTTPPPVENPPLDWLDLISTNSENTLYLLFTYIFTLLTLRFVYQNYRRFIHSRQLFSLELVHSIPARTIMVTDLPLHLQGERPLAEYFENMGLAVESVTVCREVTPLKALLDKRTAALMALEACWVQYVGNPSTVESYDPSDSAPVADDPEIGRSSANRLVVPHNKRPTIRPSWFARQVDALEYLESQFKLADEAVKKKRRSGKYKATPAAFVTFETMSSAQIALQTAHSPTPGVCNVHPAPEPRDIVWSSMALSPTSLRIRDVIALACMGALLTTWFIPVAFLAQFLSYKEIEKVMPWLARLIDRDDKIKALVQNSLPSVAIITLNALLPFMLEWLTYFQGYRARSWIEYSLMKKYFLFLLINVVFIFLFASTYWQLLRDLAESPVKIPEKLANALQAGTARNFFLSYVILQGLGIMPLQLLNLGVVIPRIFYRLFMTRTPRDFAELNAPPMINYGVVYPQSILIFVIILLYSVVQPLILIFGAIYFGMAYIVYKYKLLFVFYKPYESQGQAWPITFMRLIWGVMIFLIFMAGTFALKKAVYTSFAVAPLIITTVFWTWRVEKTLKPLSKYVSLSSVFEVQRGEETADVRGLRQGHPVTWSQTNLSRSRYGTHDDTLYVAPEDERTDYSQPPMANWYSGVLNTGKRRYGHPALNGVLPEPWLPLKKGQTLANHNGNGSGARKRNKTAGRDAVVLTLRNRFSIVRRPSRPLANVLARDGAVGPGGVVVDSPLVDVSSNEPRTTTSDNPWEDAQSNSRPVSAHVDQHSPSHLRRSKTAPAQQLHHRLSFDAASGVITLPDDGDWLIEDVDSDEDDDYGVESTGSPGLGELQSEGEEVPERRPLTLDTELTTSPTSPTGGPSSLLSPSKKRYGTYWHHPSKRRATVAGALTKPSSS